MGSVLLSFFYLIASALANNERIVNGTKAEENEYPFAISLRYEQTHVCGGTILNSKFVLTAAHCVGFIRCLTGFEISSKYSVRYGSNTISATNENTIDVKKIFCPVYIPLIVLNDVAVLELMSEILKGNNWKQVTLAKSFKGAVSHSGVIIGWGSLRDQNGPYPTYLHKANVNVYNDDTCIKTNIANSNHICLGGQNVSACFGDSGGPLLVNNEQVGIASFVINEKCGIANEREPIVYTRVDKYYEWIANVAGL